MAPMQLDMGYLSADLHIRHIRSHFADLVEAAAVDIPEGIIGDQVAERVDTGLGPQQFSSLGSNPFQVFNRGVEVCFSCMIRHNVKKMLRQIRIICKNNAKYAEVFLFLKRFLNCMKSTHHRVFDRQGVDYCHGGFQTKLAVGCWLLAVGF